MSWLTKFKADPQNLIGPNITKSPVHEIDLSFPAAGNFMTGLIWARVMGALIYIWNY